MLWLTVEGGADCGGEEQAASVMQIAKSATAGFTALRN
jgi:hypothetical protein